MRKQLNELMELAKQVKKVLREYKLNDVTHRQHQVSTWITAHSIGDDYASVSFLSMGSKKLDVQLYNDDKNVINNITVDVENLSDKDLDDIILRSTQDIGIFIADLEANAEIRRLETIEKLQNQLRELKGDVSTN